jgi:hypothetical protein
MLMQGQGQGVYIWSLSFDINPQYLKAKAKCVFIPWFIPDGKAKQTLRETTQSYTSLE